jgi:hypothetical protein
MLLFKLGAMRCFLFGPKQFQEFNKFWHRSPKLKIFLNSSRPVLYTEVLGMAVEAVIGNKSGFERLDSRMVFSILRVFSPKLASSDLDAATCFY